MEYRKSVLIILADDVNANSDWGTFEDTMDVFRVSGKNAAKEYFQTGQKKTDAVLLYVNKEVDAGYALIEYIARDVNWCGVPVLVVASEYDAEEEQK